MARPLGSKNRPRDNDDAPVVVGNVPSSGDGNNSPANGGVIPSADGTIIIDPAEFGGDFGGVGGSDGPVDSADAPKRRGRKPGTGKKTKTQAVISPAAIEMMLFSIHQMIAVKTTPHIAIDKDEAKVLAQGIADVAKHYEFLASAMTDKAAAWLALAQVAFVIYGPKVMTIYGERKKKGEDIG